MLKILVFTSSFVAVFISECQIYVGASEKISISRCDGQMKTGNVLGVNYNAINSHCNCTIISRYNGNLTLASNSITENCFTEITVTILELQQAELITIPCKGKRAKYTLNITHDNVLYLTSRSVNTTTEPERFLQDITIFGGADNSISVTCGSTLQSSSAQPSDIITTTENGYTSSTVARSNFFTKTSPDDVSTYSKRDLESNQPPSTTEEIQWHIQQLPRECADCLHTNGKHVVLRVDLFRATYSIFVAVGSGIVVIAVIIVIIICKRRRNQEKGTNKSDKLLYGGQRNVAKGNNELPYNPLHHQFNNEADGGYSTMGDVNRSPCDELPENPLYHSHQENIKANGPANMVEEKTGKEDIPMSDTGSNAIYAQQNKVQKGPKSEVDDISPTENVYAQVKKPDKK